VWWLGENKVEICKEHLAKADRCMLKDGSRTTSYSDKAGARHFSSEIVSNTVVFLDFSFCFGEGRRSALNAPRVADLAPRASQSLDGSSNFAHAGMKAYFKPSAASHFLSLMDEHRRE